MKYIANLKGMNEMQNMIYMQKNHALSRGFPEEITITTTLKCNYRCKMCYQKDFSQEMDWRIVDKLKDILPFAVNIQLFGGEPMVFPRIGELFEVAHQNSCLITMISNGSLLTPGMINSILENRVAHIKFSIDAGSPRTYKHIRGGDFFKVLKGIAGLSRRKITMGLPFPELHFNFLAMRSNVHELTKLVAIASDLGIERINVFYPSCHNKDLVEECVYFCQDESDHALMMAREAAQRLGVGLRLPPLFGECAAMPMEASKRSQCADPWTKLLIDPDGTCSLCCSGPTKIGSLLEDDFDTIWNCDKAKRLRELVNTPDEPAYCRNCRVRKPIPSEIGLHIGDNALQKYACDRYGIPWINKA